MLPNVISWTGRRSLPATGATLYHSASPPSFHWLSAAPNVSFTARRIPSRQLTVLCHYCVLVVCFAQRCVSIRAFRRPYIEERIPHSCRVAPPTPKSSCRTSKSTPTLRSRRSHSRSLLMSVDLRQAFTSLRFPSRVESVSRTQLSRVHTGDSNRPAET
ncbi:uncharacterized protein EI97DRAFT_63741 [Westerdykella ornata]|uniref:Uncharacterized protein n=1 Tax=Westerdykella ornata TaxID=318751 RepID=A0A6A6JHV4_WESOR|nr:uncharacterized protein EI97DRAFT_63741 [Westerdykella ornata]KAF2275538.1 hypothetical protein EI97DRAFT_63741 [Westerdykella ornata]